MATVMEGYLGHNIDEAQMRSVVRLLGEVATYPGGLMGKRCHLLDGLCVFTGADEWRWSLRCRKSSRCLGFLRHQMGHPLILPSEEPEVQDVPSLKDLIPPTRSNASMIVSRKFSDAQTESRIALVHSRPETVFPPDLAFLASLVLEEIVWLHWVTDTPRVSETLPPRCQQVCDLLLLGLGRKEIADHLAISSGTVSGYVRAIYRRFNVTSQAEFIRRHRSTTTSNL